MAMILHLAAKERAEPKPEQLIANYPIPLAAASIPPPAHRPSRCATNAS
jgi:hypothetical protein